MAKPGEDRLDAALRALADPTRRAILAMLRDGDRSVGALAAPFPMTLAALLKHVRLLQTAGLVVTWKTGRTRQVRLEPMGFAAANAVLDDYRPLALPLPRFDATAGYIDLSDMDVT